MKTTRPCEASIAFDETQSLSFEERRRDGHTFPHTINCRFHNQRHLTPISIVVVLNITMLAAASVAALGFTATTPAAAMPRSCVRTESAVMLEQPSTRCAHADSYRVPC